MYSSKTFGKIALIGTTALCFPTLAYAQDGATEASVSNTDIIVTARKRNETSLNVPVTLAAVGAAELERRAISGLDGLATVVPGLVIMEQGGTMQGGTVSLRGITGPNSNNLGDQAVSFSIDGVSIAKASVRRLASFDMQQIEVLKGPQALFFGKNSPGGVVSMTTADPGDQFEAKASLGFEKNAHELRGEGYVSAPLTESLGARLAVLYDDSRGWVRNTYPAGTPISPKHKYSGRNTEYALRGTLKFDDGGPLTARLKLTMSRKHGDGIANNTQTFSCPSGVLYVPPGSTVVPGFTEDCKANSTTSHPDIGPSFFRDSPYDKRFSKGNYFKSRSQLGSLELNYEMSDELNLTSVTGFYNTKGDGVDHYTYPYAEALLPSAGTFKDREFSEELRLTSNYDGPVNFMFGGLYTSATTSIFQHTLFGVSEIRNSAGAVIFGSPTNVFGLPSPTEFNEYNITQKGKAYSAFGQMQWKPVEKIEVSLGGRYSHEEKRLTRHEADFRVFGTLGDPTLPAYNVPVSPTKITFSDFSPEISLAYRPTQDLNLYTSYKRGFLSGGYNGSSDVLQPGKSPDYGQQTVRGFEIGAKAALLDNTLRLNLAAFTYIVKGLQVAGYEAGVVTIRNAGKVGVKGVEGDFNWRTPLTGLEVRGSMAYVRSRYKVYVAPCYTNQTFAQGCNLFGPEGNPIQDLAGTPVPNAPNWTLTGGFNYSTPLGTGLKLGLSSDVNYRTSFVTDSKNSPNSRPPAMALVDASITLGAEDDLWEFALVGRNLTNKYFWNDSQGMFPGPATGREDRYGTISRGRELWARVTFKIN